MNNGGLRYKIEDHKNLTRTQEYYLIAQWQRAKCYNSRSKLIRCNQKFVAGIAYLFKRKYSRIPIADLIHYGYIGFMKSLNRFDISTGNRLDTCASSWIRQSIQRGVEDNESLIRAPANIHEVIRKKIKKKIDLNDDEKAIMENCHAMNKMDDPVGMNDTKMTISDKYSFSAHDTAQLQDHRVYVNSRNKRIHELIEDLSDEDQGVIKGIYGLNHGVEQTLREVGESLNMSHEQARKRRTEVLKLLKPKIAKII